MDGHGRTKDSKMSMKFLILVFLYGNSFCTEEEVQGEYCPVCDLSSYCAGDSHCCNNNDGQCCPVGSICIPFTSICMENVYAILMCTPVALAVIAAVAFCIHSTTCRRRQNSSGVTIVLPDQTEWK